MNNFKNRIGIALSLSILLSIVIVIFSPTAYKSAILRGDFPGFYVLAKIVADGNSSELYNLTLQKQIENQAWPELNGNFLISVYPPSLAIILCPLGLFSALHAQLIFSILSIIFLIISFKLLIERIAFLNDSICLLFALLITQPFLLIGTIGGQNTAFSAAILSIGISLIEKMHKNNSTQTGLLAGLVLSLWLFKPQFGILLLPGLLCFKLWAPLFGYLIGAFFHYLAGSILLGIMWPIEWSKKVIQFSSLNYSSNDINQSSLFGTINVVFKEYLSNLPANNFILLACIIATTSIVLYVLKKAESQKNSAQSICLLWTYVGFIPLISPQTLFYDIGIIFIATLNCLRNKMSVKTEQVVLIIFVSLQVIAFAIQLSREKTPYPIFWTIALSYWLIALFSARRRIEI